jgi:Lsr2
MPRSPGIGHARIATVGTSSQARHAPRACPSPSAIHVAFPSWPQSPRTCLVDDLDETEEDVENVLLALDGTNYEIDLSASNAGRLREKLARFVDAASAVNVSKSAPAKRGTSGKAAPVPSNRDQVQAIREWAKAAGYEVSGRGRISKAIQDAFDAAH